MTKRAKRQLITESEWRTCPDPHRLVRWSRRVGSARKYLLLSCALVRNWPGGIRTEIGRNTLDAVEKAALQTEKPNRVRVYEDILKSQSPLFQDNAWSTGYHTRRRHLLQEDEFWIQAFVIDGSPLCRTGKTLPNVLINNALQVARTVVGRETTEEVQQIEKELIPPKKGGFLALLTSAPKASQDAVRDAILSRLPEPPKNPGNTVLCARMALQEYRYRQRRDRMGDLVREIMGDPFRPWYARDGWLAAHDGAMQGIAENIERNRVFADMPILGDALEDAGCQDTTVLNHCRNGTSHALGCWVLDAILRR